MKVYGPYLSRSRGRPRRFVVLVAEDGSRRSTSYARHLMEQHLGRALLPEETVDHIDGDPLNDSVANFQLLTLADNIRKASPGREFMAFDCPNCGVRSSKPANVVRHNRKQGKAGPFCSRRCAGRWQHHGE